LDIKKPQYSDFLNLFFRGAKKHRQQQPFHLNEKDEKKVKLVQKYLKNEFNRDETDVRNETARVYNVAVSQNFFQDSSVINELNVLLNNRKLGFERLAENFSFKVEDDVIEFDLVAYGEDTLLVMNIYAVADEEDIDYFIEDLREIRDSFPEYMNHKIYGAIGVLEIENEPIKYANRWGIFVIKKSGDSIVVANRKNFKPKNW
jgi:hypothetical protein